MIRQEEKQYNGKTFGATGSIQHPFLTSAPHRPEITYNPTFGLEYSNEHSVNSKKCDPFPNFR